MLISENWLRERVDPPLSTHELADTLTMAGLEVGNISPQNAQFSHVVVAQILSVKPHPDAGKLKLCLVSLGEPEHIDVVCGARNVYAGMKVAFAKVGAILPTGLEIKKTSIRGSESSGMLCSMMELGLADKSDGIIEFESSAVLGDPVESHLKLDDQVIELELTPNRGDCLSIDGVAKELAALTDSPLKAIEVTPVVASSNKQVSISIEDYSGCPRYVGRIIESINTQSKTPDWMKEKLRRCGLRPISAVVDITNYVMLELGQPMHAFDLSNIDTGIIVRRANKGETLTLLDENILMLQEDDLLICDYQGPIALAGIMGGLGSGINENTQTVLLESAYFTQSDIIGKARRIGIQTDASFRYERGVDPYLQETAIERASALLMQICGGVPAKVVEAVDQSFLPVKSKISTRFSQINKVLGVEISPEKARSYLLRLGCQVEQYEDELSVIPPQRRFDLSKEHDLIEEIARIYGYNNIPENQPVSTVTSSLVSEAKINNDRYRNLVIDLGYHETINYSFVDPCLQEMFHNDRQAIELKNPIATNLSVMRLSLVTGLLQALANNYHRQHRQIKLIEFGNIYYLDNNQRLEEYTLGGILTGHRQPEQWASKSEELDFYDVKSDVESILKLSNHHLDVFFRTIQLPGFHPGRTAQLFNSSKCIGFIGELLPSLLTALNIEQSVYFFQLNLNDLLMSSVPAFSAVSKYPSIRRDLSILIDVQISSQSILTQVTASAGEYLTDLKIFDVYTGKPIDSFKKSVSIGLTFQALDRTLTEQEMDDACSSVLENLKNKFKAGLRE